MEEASHPRVGGGAHEVGGGLWNTAGVPLTTRGDPADH